MPEDDITMSENKGTDVKKPPDPPDPPDPTEKTNEIWTYEAGDEGPYILFVQGANEEGEGIERIHPMALGNMFKKLHPEIANKMSNIYKNGKNRLKLVMKDIQSANILATSEKMKEKGFLVYIPKFYVTKQGIIKGVFTELSEEEIMKDIELPLELQYTKVRVISVKRFNRKFNDAWIPTETVQVTFRAQQLPTHITLHYVRCKVEAFIPRVLQCSKCLRYGHPVKSCKSKKARCNTCGGDDHDIHDCTVLPPPKCIHCEGSHNSYVDNPKNNNCPEYKKQVEIKKIMTLENKTFLEARGALRKSYASKITNNSNNKNITNSNPSTPVPQPSSTGQIRPTLYRKRRSEAGPTLDLNLQKQREMYNLCNRDTNLPLSPIIINNMSGNNKVSQPASPSLCSQNFTFCEKVKKVETQPKSNEMNIQLPMLILSIMKSVFGNEEAKKLSESDLLIFIKNQIELLQSKSNEPGSD